MLVLLLLLIVLCGQALGAQTTASTVSIQHALCPGVSSTVVHPLQLGSLRLRSGDNGWIYLDGSGELYSSANVSKNPAFPPSNGVIRIRGPQQQRVHIDLALLPWRMQNEPQQAAAMAEIFTVRSLQVFGRGNTVVEHVMNNEYVVVLPVAEDAEYSEVELLLGLEAHVSMKNGPQQITTSVQLRCLGIEHR
ncbi:hypothetical protein [Aliidiomarina sp.]|uniref:hypothetical protein n=1 Tax=Aliidiomarina sp. TaxID=1872439 RepID=UPI003A4E22D9